MSISKGILRRNNDQINKNLISKENEKEPKQRARRIMINKYGKMITFQNIRDVDNLLILK